MCNSIYKSSQKENKDKNLSFKKKTMGLFANCKGSSLCSHKFVYLNSESEINKQHHNHLKNTENGFSL